MCGGVWIFLPLSLSLSLSNATCMPGHTDWAEVVAWSSDGLHIASGAFEKDASIIIWNAVKGTELLACKGALCCAL